jgi:pilus assembly protein Flp/PilA
MDTIDTLPSAPTPSRPADLRRFLADERGATAIEYGLMIALISLTIIGTIEALGQSINSVLFGQIVTALANMSK